MNREDVIGELRDIFRRYLETKRRLITDFDRVALKGWPDRKADLRALTELATLVMESRNRAALEGPVKDAGRDPEFGLLCAAFAKSNDELDLQFRALRLRWPEDGINP